jgi:hypothetical protein
VFGCGKALVGIAALSRNLTEPVSLVRKELYRLPTRNIDETGMHILDAGALRAAGNQCG